MALGRSRRQPVVVFPELVRSNGEGVLTFAKEAFEGLETSATPVRAHVFAFRWACSL